MSGARNFMNKVGRKKGHIVTEETRRKISETLKRSGFKWANPLQKMPLKNRYS